MTTDQRTTQRVAASITRNPGATDLTIAKNMWRYGVKVGDVAAIRAGMADAPPTLVAAKAPRDSKPRKVVGSLGKTLDSFRAAHDVAHIIETNITDHLKDTTQEYYTDHEFREICGVASSNWRRFADDTKFADHRLVRGSHNLWASKKMIREMRKILGI